MPKQKTKIEWCDYTINPVTGCNYNCSYCYARKLNNRFKWIEEWNKPKFFPNRLKGIEKIKQPSNIFMNSMSDIADWKEEWWQEVSKYIKENPQHNYIFLTKRPEKLLDHFYKYIRGDNCFLGYSYIGGLDPKVLYELQVYSFKNNFLSIEPIEWPMDHELFNRIEKNSQYKNNLKWIIIGAETGNRKDKIIPKKEWIDYIVDFAKRNGIKVFMKDSLIPIVGEQNMIREFPEKLDKKVG